MEQIKLLVVSELVRRQSLQRPKQHAPRTAHRGSIPPPETRRLLQAIVRSRRSGEARLPRP
jgi:hypothetical protein